MKEGDVVEWRGVDKTQRGRIEILDGLKVCRLANGKVLPLDLALRSKSAKVIKQ